MQGRGELILAIIVMARARCELSSLSARGEGPEGGALSACPGFFKAGLRFLSRDTVVPGDPIHLELLG